MTYLFWAVEIRFVYPTGSIGHSGKMQCKKMCFSKKYYWTIFSAIKYLSMYFLVENVKLDKKFIKYFFFDEESSDESFHNLRSRDESQ